MVIMWYFLDVYESKFYFVADVVFWNDFPSSVNMLVKQTQMETKRFLKNLF